MDNLLSIVTFIPAGAAAVMALLMRGEDEAAQRNAKWLALMATSLTFLVSLGIYFQFDPNNTGFQFVEERDWIFGLQYKMGVDGISVLFVMLTTFVMPLTILASARRAHEVPLWAVASLAFVHALGAHRACALRVRCFLMRNFVWWAGISNAVTSTNGDLAGVVVPCLAVSTSVAAGSVHAHLVKCLTS